MSEQSYKPYKPPSFFIPSLLLGAGIALGFTLLGGFLYKSVYFFKTDYRSLSVRGLAEEIVKSDRAKLSFNILVYNDSISSVYQKSQDQISRILKFLKDEGWTEGEIDMEQQTIHDEGLMESRDVKREPEKRYRGSVRFRLKTPRVDDVQALSKKIPTLTEQDIIVDDLSLHYFYSKFSDKRPMLLKKGIRNAQEAAKNMAKEMNLTLGSLHDMNQGFVEISGPDGEQYGEEKSFLYKKLRVVLSTTWGIQSPSIKP